ncbi:hypothetical protein AGMMS49992_12410 [Clostridia bacterium]|nr:hypothetical protein AGMMS49992_12410 [Clostridia bacterium]
MRLTKLTKNGKRSIDTTNAATIPATNGLWTMLRTKSGFGGLDKVFARFVTVDMLYNGAEILSGAFFNIFLLRATGDAAVMMRFSILQHMIMPFVMVAGVWVARRLSVSAVQKMGFAAQIIAYAMLSLGASAPERVAIPAALVLGAAGACYYISYSPMLLRYSSDSSRDAGLAALHIGGTLLALIMPVLTGLFINSFSDLAGYRVLFAGSAAIALACLCVSFKLAPLKMADVGRRTRFKEALKRMRANRLTRYTMLATATYASRFSVFTFFASLLGYQTMGSERAMGFVGLAASLVGLGASVLYGKFVKPRSRGNAMLIAVAVLGGCVGLIIARLNVWTWVLYTIGTQATRLFIDTPPLSAHLSVVSKDPDLDALTPEITALREGIYTLGYVVSSLPILFMADPAAHVGVMLLASIGLMVVSALSVRVVSERTS